MTDVALAVENLRAARAAVADAERRLWNCLLPSIASLLANLEELGVSQDEATAWLIGAHLPNGDSVLDLLAAGREEDVRAAVQRMTGGIGA